MTKNQMNQRPVYYIGFKNDAYKVDPVIFAKYSSKFAEDLPKNEKLMEFNENVEDETFKAFIASNQLKPFEIQPMYILELLDVARKWGCPSLETYCQDFCKKNGITYRSRDDPLGILIQHIDNDCETEEDLEAVAAIFNDLIYDDRLPDVEPELLFRIVYMAEKMGMEQEKLIEFIFSIIKTVPETAVLLSLFVNFDNLTEEQEKIIFHTADMHQLSINFFVAASLSSVRYKTRKELNEISQVHQETLDQFINNVEAKKKKLIQDLQDDHNAQMEEVMNVLEEQHRTVEELSDVLADMANKLKSGPLSAEALGDPSINKIKSDCEDQLKTYRQALEDGLDDKKMALRERFVKHVEYQKNNWITNLTDPDKVNTLHQRKLAVINEITDDLDAKLEDIEANIDQMKSLVAAMIVRDKLRTEKGTRDIDDPYSIFDGVKPIWNLDREGVQAAEKTIIGIEDRLDQECPIRGGRNLRNQ